MVSPSRVLLLAATAGTAAGKTYREVAGEMGFTLQLAERNFARLFPNRTAWEVKEGAKLMHDATMDLEYRPEQTPEVMSWNCPTLPKREPGTKISDLHPADIGAVGGVGDSISTGCNAQSTSIFNMKDYEGLAWIMGGDGFGTDKERVTLGNAFQHYTGALPDLAYGTGNSNTGDNWAKNGAIAQDMVGQVAQLKRGFQNTLGEKYNTTWKFVNILIGGNNLCVACDGGSGAKKAEPANYLAAVKDAMDQLQTFPRTFVAVSLLPDITQLQKYKSGLVCSVALWYACDCAASDSESKRAVVKQRVEEYNAELTKLVNGYPDRDDWAAVLQPALKGAEISDIDLISDADCFHPSGKGQAGFATGLWNNLVEPAGSKKTWKDGDVMRCLTADDRLTLD
jgi:small subunit ribosomal protein S29e